MNQKLATIASNIARTKTYRDAPTFAERATGSRRLRWTDPRSEWMANVEVTFEPTDQGNGSAWGLKTKKHQGVRP